MPRRRKVQVKEENPKEALSGEVVIKTEIISPEVKRTPEIEDQPVARRLRPRKAPKSRRKRIKTKSATTTQSVNVTTPAATADDNKASTSKPAGESAPTAKEAEGNLEDTLALPKPVSRPRRKRKRKVVVKEEHPIEALSGDVVIKTEIISPEVKRTPENEDPPLPNIVCPPRKTAKRRRKKIKTATADSANVTTLATTATVDDNKPSSSKPAAAATGESAPTAEEADGNLEDKLALRKPFSRGRRSRFLSVRTGKKEVVHTDEAIDPEDIRGFEHIETYSTPEGVRLPKFWDSEDEISDDESGDSFRRIMCGFGTNCRIHEVIRPASEIVRRLKELQTTFGTTKTLPLFQQERTSSGSPAGGDVGNEYAKSGEDKNLAKLSSIMWHNDPMFFQYANNCP